MSLIVDLWKSSLATLAAASNGNPVISTITVMVAFLFFNAFEYSVEEVFFGKAFSHWLDPLFALVFIVYAAHSVIACAAFNTMERDRRERRDAATEEESV